jgi:hypothetical protein
MSNDGTGSAMPGKMPRSPGFGSTRVALYIPSVAISLPTKGLSLPSQRKLIILRHGIHRELPKHP